MEIFTHVKRCFVQVFYQIKSKRLNTPTTRNGFYYVREVLEEGIKYGGTSISDYRHADGKTGEMQLHLNVYKQPVCKVCGSQIETKSSRQEIVIIVQYVKNKERVKLCRKLLV